MWCGGGPMPHKKMKLEGMLFTGSDFPENNCVFNLEPGAAHAVVSRETKRRPTLNAPDKKARKVSKLL